jgi:hypothetical protein
MYREKLLRVKALNESSLVGKIFIHYKRKTLYTITGFSVFKISSAIETFSELDLAMMVHYKDAYDQPHSRFYSDFFGYEGNEQRFKEVD